MHLEAKEIPGYYHVIELFQGRRKLSALNYPSYAAAIKDLHTPSAPSDAGSHTIEVFAIFNRPAEKNYVSSHPSHYEIRFMLLSYASW